MEKTLNEIWNENIEIIAKNYKNKINRYGLTPESFGERDETRNYAFYDELLRGIEPGKEYSVLDIGCGMGDAIPYLQNKKKINISEYQGIDIISDYIDYCKNEYSEYNFINANFINNTFQIEKRYDIVIAMATILSRVHEYEKYIENFIMKALQFTNKLFVFNLITEIDERSQNFPNKNEIGGVTSFPEDKLTYMLNKLNKDYRYNISIEKKKIYDDATDAFVKIEIR